ncbi:hypothetical protein BGX28_004882 [Mortierella sp. GBA30]|nr:hypothetical protein BGX28_004882 [Mortierella sp. GBA30]
MNYMSTKPCAAKGRRECDRGFNRDTCQKCTLGSVTCNMCSPNNASTCSFCVNGRKECDDCYGIGFVQRICQDCIKEHYRRQRNNSSSSNLTTKVRDQLNIVVQNQLFSKSMTSVYSTTTTLQQTGSSPSSTKLGLESDSDDGMSSDSSRHSTKSGRSRKSTLRSSAMKLFKIHRSIFSSTNNNNNKSDNNISSCSHDHNAKNKTQTHRRKWSWSSSISVNSLPATSIAA